MDSNEQMFYTFLITTLCGFLLALGRQMYKSKCKEIECCCVKIVRDVHHEERIDELQLQRLGRHADSDTSTLDNINIEGPRQI